MFCSFQLITAIDPLHLKLTKADDAIYEKFCKDFPNLDVEVISEDEIKSPSSKAVSIHIHDMYEVLRNQTSREMAANGFS